jgi:hypothetical protein
MKKLFFLFLLFQTALIAQDSTHYSYTVQGDGRDSWVKSEFKNGQLSNRTMVYENPNAPKWKELKMSLFASPLFQRAIVQANPNAYSTLLKVLSDGENGDGNEANLLLMINMLGMTFSAQEKAELNGYFEANNFTIRL